MKYLYIGTIAIFTFAFCQCTNKEVRNTVSEQDFFKQIDLQESQVITKPLFNIEDFFLKDSLLIIRNGRADSIFMVLHSGNFECVKSFGEKGNGPLEYNIPRMARAEDKLFLTLDFPSQKIRAIEEYFALNEVSHKSIDSNPRSILSVNDSILIFDTFNHTSQNLMKWELHKEPKSIYGFADLQKEYSNPLVYQGFIGINPNQKSMVYAYQYLRRFDILDMEGNIIKKVEMNPGSLSILLEDGRIDAQKCKTNYFGIRTTPSSFYLYYVGYTGNELMENLKRDTFIEQYNWEGKPLNRYKVSRFLSGFEVDERNQRFIGLDNTKESPFLVLEGKKKE